LLSKPLYPSTGKILLHCSFVQMSNILVSHSSHILNFPSLCIFCEGNIYVAAKE
jgi:hypothetical protein